MLNRFISCLLVSLTTGTLFLGATPQETKYEPIEIIETTPIIPDVVTLAEESVRYTKHWDENCFDNTIQISQEDAVRLMKIAVSEGGNQGVSGQLLIMQTVWNRVNSDLFPDSIQSVIEQPHQFSSVDDGRYQSAEPSWESHIALAEFEKNLSHDVNLIGFETVDNGESLLSYFDFYETYKDHNFYTLKKD